MPLIEGLKQRARQLKAETLALYLAARHPDTPWYAKLLVAAIVAYAFSPIDLIPDFIPIVGYLDDLVLIPIGIALAIKLVPPTVLAECRVRAQEVMVNGKPVSRVAGAVVVMIWVALIALCLVWAYEAFMPLSATALTGLCIARFPLRPLARGSLTRRFCLEHLQGADADRRRQAGQPVGPIERPQDLDQRLERGPFAGLDILDGAQADAGALGE